MQDNTIADQVWTWLDKVIIGENFCPFAKLVRMKQQIRLNITEIKDEIDALNAVLAECEFLDNHPEIDTTLLGFSEGFTSFDDYLALVESANACISHHHYEGTYQLASFHPEYLFAGEPESSSSHYTNRSPIPLIHIIREDSITRVLSTFKHPDMIPERNIAHAEQLGIAFFKQFLPQND
ncbi:DUF1415 domain-containing protein [Glaciecola sp. 1036]|uniref:DUF1415 domain-containing protein n=1 Tax=Alteromonadaceae TaxID=72275 RepID=UPI003D04AAA6